jgi:hypothetical protein
MSRRSAPLSADLLLRAYSLGLFPMADSRGSDKLYWLDPEQRGILPLDRFHLSRRLYRTVRSGVFEVSVDRDFPATIAGCANLLYFLRNSVSARVRGGALRSHIAPRLITRALCRCAVRCGGHLPRPGANIPAGLTAPGRLAVWGYPTTVVT